MTERKTCKIKKNLPQGSTHLEMSPNLLWTSAWALIYVGMPEWLMCEKCTFMGEIDVGMKRKCQPVMMRPFWDYLLIDRFSSLCLLRMVIVSIYRTMLTSIQKGNRLTETLSKGNVSCPKKKCFMPKGKLSCPS